jgi:hypothetical protein
MPPGQPIRRCAGCELLRPCKRFDGAMICVDCSPIEPESDRVVADGGGSDA